MQIFHHPNSTFSRRVRIWALEKGQDVELVPVDMVNREHKGDAFRAMNPYGKVPVLKHEDLVLYESAIILEYLEARYPDPPLFPEDLNEQAMTSLHIKLCDTYLAPHVGTIIFPKRFLPPERWKKDAMDQAKAQIDKHLAILEKQMEGKTYLAGEMFTLADICYMPLLEFRELMELSLGPNLSAWCERIMSRDSATQTAPAA